jgi:hypothetical protein
MNRLLGLYPRAWRERYGDELVALLEEHPATLVDLIDLIRGALDARLHPQVGGSTRPDKASDVSQRILALVAAAGGIAWIVGVGTALVLPPDMYGDPDTSLAIFGVAIGSSLIGVALGELGTRAGSGARTGHAIAVAGIALGFTVLMGWPWFIVGIVGFPMLVLLASARAYQADRLPGWSVAVLATASVAGLVGVFGNGDFVLFASIGVAALVLAVAAFRTSASATSAGPASMAPTQEPA